MTEKIEPRRVEHEPLRGDVFVEALGIAVSSEIGADTIRLRYARPHRAVVLVRAAHPSLSLAAFEISSVDGSTSGTGRLLAGGRRPRGSDHDKGVYFQPTVIAGLPDSSPTCHVDIFGPVLAAMSSHDEAEAVAIANDNPHGLALGVWIRYAWRASGVGAAVSTGTVWLDTYERSSAPTPFGGVKASGTGREKGRPGPRADRDQKSRYMDASEQPPPWAHLGKGRA